MGGLEAISQIRVRQPKVAIVILTTYNEDDLMLLGLQAGACGFLLKDTKREILFDNLRAAAKGEVLLSPDILVRALNHRAGNQANIRQPARGDITLTDREHEVLKGVAQGERSKEIAIRLGISERTVKAYLSNIYVKLGVDSRAAAVSIAAQRGWL
jgi:NarL family two-component system response regulator YdfI